MKKILIFSLYLLALSTQISNARHFTEITCNSLGEKKPFYVHGINGSIIIQEKICCAASTGNIWTNGTTCPIPEKPVACPYPKEAIEAQERLNDCNNANALPNTPNNPLCREQLEELNKEVSKWRLCAYNECNASKTQTCFNGNSFTCKASCWFTRPIATTQRPFGRTTTNPPPRQQEHTITYLTPGAEATPQQQEEDTMSNDPTFTSNSQERADIPDNSSGPVGAAPQSQQNPPARPNAFTIALLNLLTGRRTPTRSPLTPENQPQTENSFAQIIEKIVAESSNGLSLPCNLAMKSQSTTNPASEVVQPGPPGPFGLAACLNWPRECETWKEPSLEFDETKCLLDEQIRYLSGWNDAQQTFNRDRQVIINNSPAFCQIRQFTLNYNSDAKGANGKPIPLKMGSYYMKEAVEQCSFPIYAHKGDCGKFENDSLCGESFKKGVTAAETMHQKQDILSAFNSKEIRRCQAINQSPFDFVNCAVERARPACIGP